MNTNKIIWIFNQAASMLETRHLELGKQFVKQGYRCIVFTSSFHHGNHQYLFSNEYVEVEKSKDLFFIYLHVSPKYQSNGAKRIISFFRFNSLIKKYRDLVVKKHGKPNYIIASSLPPSIWEIGYSCAKRYQSKWIAEVKDLWPLQLTDIMKLPKKHPLVIFFAGIEKRAYKRSNAIVTSMPFAGDYICGELGFPEQKVHWMPNGIDTERAKQNLEDAQIIIPNDLSRFLDEHWCCVYCGSLVKSECVSDLVQSFEYLKQEDIYFAIIGSGHCENAVKEKIEKLELQDKIKMFPRVPYEQIPKILEKAKCCLAAVDDYPLYRFGLSMCKLNDYLFSGCPTIIATGFRNVVQDAGGISIPFGNKELLAEKIKDVKQMNETERMEMSQKEQAEICNNYDYRKIGERYITLLESL